MAILCILSLSVCSMKLKLPYPPTCPFCGSFIQKPEVIPLPYVEHEGGVCQCGAVYVLSSTGYDKGSAFISALLLALSGDWDLAWDLIPDEDYKEVWIEGYDPESHLVHPEGVFEGRKVRSALIFIRLAEDIQELKKEKLTKILKKDEASFDPKFKKRLRRQELENLVRKRDFSTLVNFLLAEPKNLNELQKLLYHPEEKIRLLSAYGLGLAAGHLNKQEPQRVLDLIKRLLYAGADSASSAWGALPACGEVIRNTGDQYSAYIKNILAFLAFKENIPHALIALARISEVNPKSIKDKPYLRLISVFREKVPLWQAYVIQIFSNLKARELLTEREFLCSCEVSVFDFETAEYKTVNLEELWSAYEDLFIDL